VSEITLFHFHVWSVENFSIGKVVLDKNILVEEIFSRFNIFQIDSSITVQKKISFLWKYQKKLTGIVEPGTSFAWK
jgi:hypothetical protein